MGGVKPGWRGAATLGTWLALIALSCALYAGVIDAFFVSDDFTLVRAVGEHGPFAIWSGPRGLAPGFFRPLASLSLFVDHALYGRRSWGYHLTNVVLHAGNAWLVGRIGARLARASERRLVAVTSALLFVVWPAHGEPVASIAGRTDVLAATFALASFSCYLRSLQSSRSGHRRWAGLAIGLFVAALGAKESILALPLIVLAHRWLVVAPRSPGGRGAGVAAAYVACLPLYAVVRRLAVGGWIGGYGAAVHLQHDPRFLLDNVARQVVHALGFGVPAYGSLVASGAACVLGCALVVVGAWLVVDRRRRDDARPAARPLGFLGRGVCAVAAAVAQPGHRHRRHGGRALLYFASAWLALVLAFAIGPSLLRLRRPALAVPLVAALVVAAAVLQVCRNVRWRDAGRLSRQLVATPGRAAPRRAARHPQSARRPARCLRPAQQRVGRDGAVGARWAARVRRRLPAARHDRRAVAIERRGADVTLKLPGTARGLEYWTLAATVDAPFTIVEHEPRQLRVRLPAKGRPRLLRFDRGALVPVD